VSVSQRRIQRGYSECAGTDGRDYSSLNSRAVEVWQEQQARWLEPRAAVSLARLWQGRGRRDEARELLVGICGWFSKGFDTPDLVEAKPLPEELE
jgi:predicted ATPase